VGSFEHGNELSGSIKGGEFLNNLIDSASPEGLCSIDLVSYLFASSKAVKCMFLKWELV
jgi:hypothetical protein